MTLSPLDGLRFELRAQYPDATATLLSRDPRTGELTEVWETPSVAGALAFNVEGGGIVVRGPHPANHQWALERVGA